MAANRRLPAHFKGPYCAECDDAIAGCHCQTALCVVPKCGNRVSQSSFAPVPISILLYRFKGRIDGPQPEASPGWVCSPSCLFAFMRARQEGAAPCQQALSAASDLVRVSAAYRGVDPAEVTGGRPDPRLWELAAKDQLATISRATEYANMAAIP